MDYLVINIYILSITNLYLLLYIYIYIYIYIVICRQICFVLSELISVARQYLPVAGSKPGWLKRQAKASTIQPRGDISCEVNFKRLWITITIVYIRPFNGCRDLNSSTKRLAIDANGNTITSSPENSTLHIYICVCVCVRVYPSKICLWHQISHEDWYAIK